MNQAMKNFVRKQPVVSFYIFTFVIGAIGYTPWVLASYGLFPASLSSPMMLIGGISPTLAALIVVGLKYGKSGPAYLFSQFGRRGFSKLWLMVSLLLPFVVAVSAISLRYVSIGLLNSNFTKLADFLPLLIVNFIFMNMWEEIGWRGYALPELQKKHNALISSLIVGIFWSMWHWPRYLIKDSAIANNYQDFFWFVVFTLFLSISYTWLYNSTKGSLFVASLYHSEVNTVNFILFAGVNYSVFPFDLLATIILALVLILIFKPDSLSHDRKVTFEQIAQEQNAKRELKEREKD